jgi:hypothetical protein
MVEEGKYIYCITDAKGDNDFGSIGIGGRGDCVHSIVYQDITAVVSDSPAVEYSISKENTLAHMKVIERVMDGHTVLPVKFSTIALGNASRSSEKRIKLEILKARYRELKELLAQMNNKVELGLKALWTEMKAVFNDIANENQDIKMFKKRLASGNFTANYSQRIELGRMVKNGLEAKRASEEERILETLNGVYFDLRCNKTFGDNMITNSSFLVDKSRMEEFDNLVESLNSAYHGRIRFRYVGPIPPCNFVELVISLDEEEKEE